MIRFEDYFYYDETSPTCLRWKIDIYIGEYQSVKIVSVGDVAGSFQRNKDRTPKCCKVGLNKKDYFVHRIIWQIFHEKLHDKEIIDHLNGNPWDNRISNLKVKVQRHNCQNTKRRKNNSSGVCGVFWGNKGYSGATFAIANWQCPVKGNRTKSFSVKKYGLLPAFKMAFLFRKMKIEELNRSGEDYTERHGN